MPCEEVVKLGGYRAVAAFMVEGFPAPVNHLQAIVSHPLINRGRLVASAQIYTPRPQANVGCEQGQACRLCFFG